MHCVTVKGNLLNGRPPTSAIWHESSNFRLDAVTESVERKISVRIDLFGIQAEQPISLKLMFADT